MSAGSLAGPEQMSLWASDDLQTRNAPLLVEKVTRYNYFRRIKGYFMSWSVAISFLHLVLNIYGTVKTAVYFQGRKTELPLADLFPKCNGQDCETIQDLRSHYMSHRWVVKLLSNESTPWQKASRGFRKWSNGSPQDTVGLYLGTRNTNPQVPHSFTHPGAPPQRWLHGFSSSISKYPRSYQRK